MRLLKKSVYRLIKGVRSRQYYQIILYKIDYYIILSVNIIKMESQFVENVIKRLEVENAADFEQTKSLYESNQDKIFEGMVFLENGYYFVVSLVCDVCNKKFICPDTIIYHCKCIENKNVYKANSIGRAELWIDGIDMCEKCWHRQKTHSTHEYDKNTLSIIHKTYYLDSIINNIKLKK